MLFLFVWTLPTDRYGVFGQKSSPRLSIPLFSLARVGEKSENSFQVYVKLLGIVKLLCDSHYIHLAALKGDHNAR